MRVKILLNKMSNEEIIQGNKLIAEFMGWKLGELFEWPNGGKGYVLETELKYHTSWDWLMPVVEKINKICREVGGELSNHSRDQKDLENPLDNPRHWKSWSYHNARLSTDIVYVYNGVVEFIKWYNQNNQT